MSKPGNHEPLVCGPNETKVFPPGHPNNGHCETIPPCPPEHTWQHQTESTAGHCGEIGAATPVPIAGGPLLISLLLMIAAALWFRKQ